jgi:translation elongation factor EF-G
MFQGKGNLQYFSKNSGINLQQASQVAAFREELTKCACECLPRLKGSWWARRPRGDIQRLFSDGLLAFGPHKARLNLLFNHNNALCSADANAEDECTKCADAIGSERSSCVCVWRANLRSLDQAVVGGFHAAMAQGPLCDEPMQGVGIVLEEWTLEEEEEEERCQQKYQKEEDEAKEAAEAHENGTGNMEKKEAQSSIDWTRGRGRRRFVEEKEKGGSNGEAACKLTAAWPTDLGH